MSYKLDLIKADSDILLQDKLMNKKGVIVCEIKKLMLYFKGPVDIKLIKFVATLIENLIKKKYAQNKLLIFMDILRAIYPDVTEDEVNQSVFILEDLLKSKQIKKIPVLKFAVHLAKEFILDVGKSFF